MEVVIYKREHKNLELMEGDMFVIHKPADVNESPTWISSMDKFDGMIIALICPEGYTSTCIYWLAKPVDDNDADTICSFNINWLEPVCIGDELDILDVDFFSI